MLVTFSSTLASDKAPLVHDRSPAQVFVYPQLTSSSSAFAALGRGVQKGTQPDSDSTHPQELAGLARLVQSQEIGQLDRLLFLCALSGQSWLEVGFKCVSNYFLVGLDDFHQRAGCRIQ